MRACLKTGYTSRILHDIFIYLYIYTYIYILILIYRDGMGVSLTFFRHTRARNIVWPSQAWLFSLRATVSPGDPIDTVRWWSSGHPDSHCDMKRHKKNYCEKSWTTIEYDLLWLLYVIICHYMLVYVIILLYNVRSVAAFIPSISILSFSGKVTFKPLPRGFAGL